MIVTSPGLAAPPPLPLQSIESFVVHARERGARLPVFGDVERIRMSEILRDVTLLGSPTVASA